MAVTATVLTGAGMMPIARIAPWAVNSGSISATTTLKAAPGAGKALYLEAVVISGAKSDVGLTLQDGDGTVLLGPLEMQSDGGSLFSKRFRQPIKLADNKALVVASDSEQDSFLVFVEGFTGQSPIV